MSIVPYRKNERERKRRPLDQQQVVRAAIALLDEAGMDELTMRRLAERLGVKAASLYRHVRDKDELLVLMADEISSEIPLLRPTGTWREQLTKAAWNMRRGLLAHRDAARLLAAAPPFGPRRLRHIEAVLRVLREAGMSPRDAVRAAHVCNNFVTEFVADEGRFRDMAGGSGASRKKILTEVRKHFEALPKEEFPTLVELSDALADDDPEGLFRFGLEVLLSGLEKFAKARA